MKLINKLGPVGKGIAIGATAVFIGMYLLTCGVGEREKKRLEKEKIIKALVDERNDLSAQNPYLRDSTLSQNVECINYTLKLLKERGYLDGIDSSLYRRAFEK